MFPRKSILIDKSRQDLFSEATFGVTNPVRSEKIWHEKCDHPGVIWYKLRYVNSLFSLDQLHE